MSTHLDAVPEKEFVLVILETVNGQVVMQLRDDRDDISHPNHWGLFGERLEPGEAPRVGALRELEEELGILLTGVRLNFLGRFQLEVGKVHSAYSCFVDIELKDAVLMEGQRFNAWSLNEIKQGKLDRHPIIESHAFIVHTWQLQQTRR